jgi:hypothetical protein
MTRLASLGLSIDLPQGWEGTIYQREDGHPILHAATFPLPNERGDFGNGAVDRMGWDDILLVLLEYDQQSAGTALFANVGPPSNLNGADFSPTTMQKVIPGQAGLQRFFTASQTNRAFCLYAVIGAYRRAARLAAELTTVLQTMTIGPR